MEEAINLVAELGATRVMVETDAQLAHDALQQRKPDSSRHAPIIEDLKVQRRLWFMCAQA